MNFFLKKTKTVAVFSSTGAYFFVIIPLNNKSLFLDYYD